MNGDQVIEKEVAKELNITDHRAQSKIGSKYTGLIYPVCTTQLISLNNTQIHNSRKLQNSRKHFFYYYGVRLFFFSTYAEYNSPI